MTDSNQFNVLRAEAGITSTEFADYCGMSRRYAHQIEMQRVRPTHGEWKCLVNMIREKAAA